MTDYIVRAIAKEAGILALACISTETVANGARRHRTTPIATAALGYGLTGAALLGALLKVQQRVAVKFDGSGPLVKLVAESDSYGHVRGYVAETGLPWPLPIEAADVAEALGDAGLLRVVKDVGLPELAESVVPIQTGNLDSDLVYYLTMSEQVPSLVEIGVKLDPAGGLLVAGGLLLQLMPGQGVIELAKLADRMDDLPPVEEMLVAGQTPEQILAEIFGEISYEILEQRTLVFRCGCSAEKSQQALRLLRPAELAELIKEGEAVIECHFCHERFTYGIDVLEEILQQVEARHA